MLVLPETNRLRENPTGNLWLSTWHEQGQEWCLCSGSVSSQEPIVLPSFPEDASMLFPIRLVHAPRPGESSGRLGVCSFRSEVVGFSESPILGRFQGLACATNAEIQFVVDEFN